MGLEHLLAKGMRVRRYMEAWCAEDKGVKATMLVAFVGIGIGGMMDINHHTQKAYEERRAEQRRQLEELGLKALGKATQKQIDTSPRLQLDPWADAPAPSPSSNRE